LKLEIRHADDILEIKINTINIANIAVFCWQDKKTNSVVAFLDMQLIKDSLR